jgi:hypothetical protein
MKIIEDNKNNLNKIFLDNKKKKVGRQKKNK